MRRRDASVALVVVLAVGVGACSDDADTEAGSSAASSTTLVATTTASPTAETSTTTTVSPASAGCAANDASQFTLATDEKVTTTSGGEERWYFRHLPPLYDGVTAMPVIIDFHGYTEGATVHVGMSGLGAYGDQEGIITITPEGTGPVPRWDTEFDSPDMAYVGDLLDEIEATLCVDRARIFATGLSNGAFMTSSVACVYGDRIAAFAPVAGVQMPEDCAPDRPLPVVAFHGTADTFVSFEGGVGPSALDLPAPDGSGSTIDDVIPDELRDGPPVPEIVAAWAERDGCGDELDPTTLTIEPMGDDIRMHEYDCPEGAGVRFFEIVGGGHSWPGSAFSQQIESVLGFTTMSISANEQMWNFFVHHPLPASLLSES